MVGAGKLFELDHPTHRLSSPTSSVTRNASYPHSGLFLYFETSSFFNYAMVRSELESFYSRVQRCK